MAGATQRIVVQATPLDKKTIVTKAEALNIPISELMRRGALAYKPEETDMELGVLADAAKAAADHAGAAIDGALDYIEASERRIHFMEAARVSLGRETPA